MIEGFVAVPEAGKTLACVNQSLQLMSLYHSRGNFDYKIYSNIELKFPSELEGFFELVENVNVLKQVKNGCFLFDELWKYLDSRMSTSKRNRFLSSWGIIARKRNIDILYTEQYKNLIDLRLRAITNIVAIPSQQVPDAELTALHPYKRTAYAYTLVHVIPIRHSTVKEPFYYVLDNRDYINLYDTFAEPPDLTGDSYVDRANEILAEIPEDSEFTIYKNRGDKLDHIKSFYRCNRITAVNVLLKLENPVPQWNITEIGSKKGKKRGPKKRRNK